MNKKLSMAVAGAVMAMGASAANAGITIPAGDWTIDIGGNVNAFYTKYDGDADAAYGTGGAGTLVAGATEGDTQNIRTGLLPSAIGIGGKTRQNDLDVAFQFTFFVGSDDNNNGQAGGSNSINIRQAYMTFGDKSWGTIKLGRDLGIFGSDAILSDMTLLGVGGGAAGTGGSSTLGRIGNGYLYADWVGQISYASPNWNGFSFAVGARDPWGGDNTAADGTPNTHENDTLGFEGKVQYEWAGDVAGKVWAGYIHQKVEDTTGVNDYDADAYELGGKVSVAGFGLVANWQDGEGQGDALFAENGSNGTGDELDSQNWYVQGTYTLPTIGTKIGLSYGETEVEFDNGDAESESWIAGVYHPLTKSVNLVAEYTDIDSEDSLGREADSKTVAIGAIMFF
jgi:predicted porin